MRLFVIFVGGLFFGFGLALSGMTKPEVVLSFLQLQDLGLLLVMLGAAVVAGIAFYVAPRARLKPVMGGVFGKKPFFMDRNTIIGGAIFGVGWGLSGLCPGSAIASIGIGNYPILLGVFTMFLGAYVQGKFFG